MSRSFTYTCENEHCLKRMRIPIAEYERRLAADMALWCEDCAAAGDPPQRMVPGRRPRKRKTPRPTQPPVVLPTKGDPMLETILAAERSDPYEPLGALNGELDTAGVIVTAREQTTGDMLTLTRPGLATEALANLCRVLDRLEGVWKIVTVSTPRVILGDLQGAAGGRQHTPEAVLLGTIGRQDMLEQRHRVVSERGHMPRRRGVFRRPAA